MAKNSARSVICEAFAFTSSGAEFKPFVGTHWRRTPVPITCNSQLVTCNHLLTPTISARKATNMGKQHNKVEKRRRRKEYLRRKKSAAKGATKR
jgi:hypothetical protein